MKLYKEGEKGKGICKKCKAVVITMFKVDDVPLQSRRGIVSGILVSKCTVCDSLVSIPQQSVARVKDVIRDLKEESFEARLPVHLKDVWANCSVLLTESGTEIRAERLILRYYLGLIQDGKIKALVLTKSANSDFAKGKASSRFSLKENKANLDTIRSISEKVGLDTAALLRAISVQIKNDILDGKSPPRLRELRKIANFVM